VFGISDGLVSNVALILGTAGAHPGAGVVRLAGLAGLFGGSFSMAAGEYVSMRAQREAFEHEIAIERDEIHHRPESEQRELARIYERRGIPRDLAEELSARLMADPKVALDTHAREELGLDPDELGSPSKAAIASFATFAVGAVLPLVPYLVGATGTTAILTAIVVAALAALGIGAALSLLTSRPWWYSASRQLLLCAAAGAITYAIGSAVGVASG
jgi:VIT1/CCC1 family predicted Fe2+/Mn2+ transporter